MANHNQLSEKLESRIAFDENDWAIRVGYLQLGIELGCDQWWSDDNRILYKITSYDDKFDDEDHNPGPWLIAMTDLRQSVDRNVKRQYRDSTCYSIDEARRTINVFEIINNGQLANSREANFQEIANLSNALDELGRFLNK